VEKRAAMVYIGSHEGWATAAHIDDTAGTFLERFKPQIKGAQLKRKAEERGKGWFFRTGRSRAKKRKWDFSPAGARTSNFEAGPSYQERMFPRDRGASNQLQFPSSSSSSKPRVHLVVVVAEEEMEEVQRCSGGGGDGSSSGTL